MSQHLLRCLPQERLVWWWGGVLAVCICSECCTFFFRLVCYGAVSGDWLSAIIFVLCVFVCVCVSTRDYACWERLSVAETSSTLRWGFWYLLYCWSSIAFLYFYCLPNSSIRCVGDMFLIVFVFSIILKPSEALEKDSRVDVETLLQWGPDTMQGTQSKSGTATSSSPVEKLFHDWTLFIVLDLKRLL